MSRVVRRYADTPEGQVHLRERPGDGPVVVLLHQTPSSSVMWEDVMAAYPPGPRIIAPDTPGFGASDPPSALPADGLGYYARRLVGVLDALGVERADVAGHHTGAMIATELAVAAPERVRRLVLLGTVLVTPEEGEDYLEHHVNRWVPDGEAAFVARDLVPRLLECVTTGDPRQTLVEFAAHLQAGPDWWWAYEGVFRWDGAGRLPLITAPTLCAAGAEEPEIMRVWTAATAALIPGARHVELEGLGGQMSFEDPARTAGVISRFLSAA